MVAVFDELVRYRQVEDAVGSAECQQHFIYRRSGATLQDILLDRDDDRVIARNPFNHVAIQGLDEAHVDHLDGQALLAQLFGRLAGGDLDGLPRLDDATRRIGDDGAGERVLGIGLDGAGGATPFADVDQWLAHRKQEPTAPRRARPDRRREQSKRAGLTYLEKREYEAMEGDILEAEAELEAAEEGLAILERAIGEAAARDSKRRWDVAFDIRLSSEERSGVGRRRGPRGPGPPERSEMADRRGCPDLTQPASAPLGAVPI